MKYFVKGIYACAAMVMAIFFFSCSSGSDKQKLSLLSWYIGEVPGLEEFLIQKAKSIDIDLQIESSEWSVMHPLIQSRIAANNLMDILDLKGQDVARYAPSGVLLNLTGKPFLENLPQVTREGLQIDGKDYAIPFTSLYQGVFYNRALFAQYNIEIPKTYAELMDVAKKFKSLGITPFATHFKNLWSIGNITMQAALVNVFRNDPTWGDKLFAGEVTFENSRYRQVFQVIKDLYDNTWDDTFSVILEEAAGRFIQGKAAMMVSGTWALRTFVIDPEFDYGIFPFPGTEPGAKLIFEPNHVWAASAQSDSEAVDKFLKMLAEDPEIIRFVVENGQEFSLIPGVTPSKSFPSDTDINQYQQEGNLMDVSIGNKQIIWAYQEEYSRYIVDWLLGQKTLDEALRAATIYKDKLNK